MREEHCRGNGKNKTKKRPAEKMKQKAPPFPKILQRGVFSGSFLNGIVEAEKRGVSLWEGGPSLCDEGPLVTPRPRPAPRSGPCPRPPQLCPHCPAAPPALCTPGAPASPGGAGAGPPPASPRAPVNARRQLPRRALAHCYSYLSKGRGCSIDRSVAVVKCN